MASALLSVRCPLHLYPTIRPSSTFFPSTSTRRANAYYDVASTITNGVTGLQCAHIIKLKAAPPNATQEPTPSFQHTALFSASLLANLFLPLVATAFSMDGLSSCHQLMQFSIVADLDPSVASLLVRILGPVFATLNFLFIIRIVMSWYPQLPVDKFPYVVAFAPTEPVLEPTRKLIPPVGGVDVSPVIWVALMSFLHEILLGQQGLLVLLSQQQG